jgi:hypothetical protein
MGGSPISPWNSRHKRLSRRETRSAPHASRIGERVFGGLGAGEAFQMMSISIESVNKQEIGTLIII